MKILVIDDSPTARREISAIVEELGYECVEAVDGIEALSMIRTHEGIGLALCDINMPERDGLKLIRVVSQDENLTPPPFIMVTTEMGHDLMKKAKSFGAKGWVVKPIDREALVGLTKKYCKPAA